MSILNGKQQDKQYPIFPEIEWNDREYAQLRGRLHLFEDHIVLEKIDGDQTIESYIVDPADLAARLNNTSLTTGLLPKNCVFWARENGHEKIGVYLEPQIWPLSVQGEKETCHVPLPGLIFVGHEKKYTALAIKEAGWPNGQAELYHAPMPNIYLKTGICSGNIKFPLCDSNTIWTAVEMFMQARFNDHLANNKSKKYKATILDQWHILSKNKAKQYPINDMISTGLTLSDFLWGRDETSTVWG